jgi:hypothetical protein
MDSLLLLLLYLREVNFYHLSLVLAGGYDRGENATTEYYIVYLSYKGRETHITQCIYRRFARSREYLLQLTLLVYPRFYCMKIIYNCRHILGA